MGKYTYFVIDEINPENGLCIAHAERVANCYNLKDFFKPFQGCEIVSINACDTWTEAKRIADTWNASHLAKGCYMLATDKIYPCA